LLPARECHAQAQEERNDSVVCEIPFASILFSKPIAEVCLAMVQTSGARVVASYARIQRARRCKDIPGICSDDGRNDFADGFTPQQ